MVVKIQFNKYCRAAILKNVKQSKNGEFLIWEFESKQGKVVGFTPSQVFYGNKTYMWYSLLVGYYLPYSYTMNFENIINKECYVTINSKGQVVNIIPKQEPNSGGNSHEPSENLFE